MKDEYSIVANLIRNSNKIAVLTGAGISTNAGIPDFRGKSGIYTSGKCDAEKVFDAKYFYRDPAPFYEFARDFVSLIDKAEPTFTHKFLKYLEESGFSVTIITQNIDMLHERAGSKNVINLHGSIGTSHCISCGKSYDYDEMKKKIFKEHVPRCLTCHGIIKPDIVFFGEEVHDFELAERAVSNSDLFIAAGTSLTVYPAAILTRYAKGRKVAIVEGANINQYFDCVVESDLDDFFKKVYNELKEG